MRPFYFKKISANRFENHICSNKLKEFGFFWKIFFQGLRALLTTEKPLIWASFFSTKNYFYLTFQVWLFYINTTLFYKQHFFSTQSQCCLHEHSDDLNQPLKNIMQNFHDDVIIITLTLLLWHRGKTWKILSIMLSCYTCSLQVGYVEYCSLLHHYHFTWVISKKFWSKYI